MQKVINDEMDKKCEHKSEEDLDKFEDIKKVESVEEVEGAGGFIVD